MNDTVACVDYLVSEGKVDPKRVAIVGGSAGGYTVLASLCASKVFTAGVSLYGVSDLALLAGDTHKFESQVSPCRPRLLLLVLLSNCSS